MSHTAPGGPDDQCLNGTKGAWSARLNARWSKLTDHRELFLRVLPESLEGESTKQFANFGPDATFDLGTFPDLSSTAW